MKIKIFLIALLLMDIPVLMAQPIPKTKCLTDLFQKEQKELSQLPRLHKKGIAGIQEHTIDEIMEFWVFKHPWAKIHAICKAVGDYAYIFVEEKMWDQGFVDQDDINAVLKSFEKQTFKDSTKGIYQTDVENFGPVPNALDGDPKVYILFYDMSFYGDGAFFAFDQYTQEQIDSVYGTGFYYSNEKELLYMNAKNDVSSNLMLSVVAHEFQHMIHWNMDPDEESWINEGCAEYAMYLYGYPDPIVVFNMYPDNDLTMWDSGFGDYIQSYLFIMYLYEKYGGAETIKSLVAEPLNSIEGVEQTLINISAQRSFKEVFTDWVIANYLDVTTSYEGQYGYRNIVLPVFDASRSHSQYPIENVEGSVSPWAADYIWMNNGTPQTLNFEGDNEGSFNVNVIKIDTASQITIDSIVLDDNQNGSYEVPDFDERMKQVVLVISNQKSFGAGSYSYSSTTLTDVKENTDPPSTFSLSQNYPNPFNPSTTIKYSIPTSHQPSYSQREGVIVSLKVYDILGREIATLVNKQQKPGYYEVQFTSDNVQLTSGVYLYRLVSDGFVKTKKMILMK